MNITRRVLWLAALVILGWLITTVLAPAQPSSGPYPVQVGINFTTKDIFRVTNSANGNQVYMSNGLVVATGSGNSTFVGSVDVINQLYGHNLQADDCDFNGNLHGGAGTFSFATTNNGFGNLSANALAFNLFTFNQDAIGNFWFEDYAHSIPLMWFTNDGSSIGLKAVFIGPNTTNTIAGTNSLEVGGGAQFDGFIVPSPGSLIRTNFVSGQIYNNNTGAPIEVSANAVLTLAAVAGDSTLSLRITGQGGVTNQFGQQTLVTSLSTTNIGFISGWVTNGGTYTFTNTSVGAGDSATVTGGQIIVY